MTRLFATRRLEHSFAISSALLMVLAIGAIALVVDFRVERVLKRGLEARARSVAQGIGAVATPSLLVHDYHALQNAAERAAGDPDIRYVVIRDAQGRVAGKSCVPGSRPPGVDDTAVRRGDVRVRRIDHRVEDATVPVLEVGVPVHVDGVRDSRGFVQVGMDYGVVAAELRHIQVALALVGLALALVAVAAARWAARRITAPLRRVARATEALSRGELSHRIPVTGSRDLAELAEAFNVMMNRVQEKAAESREYQSELAQLNAALEHQIGQRARALRESEEQYRSLVEQSPESILIVQHDALRFVNPSFIRTFGISAHRALSKSFRLQELFDEPSAERVRARIAAWTSGEPAGSVEVLGRDAIGRECRFELRGRRIDYRGRAAAACLLVDITDAQQLREQLEDSNRLRALGELSSGVAHDFNNLLGAILGRVQLLRRSELPQSVDRDLEIVERAARDGRRTVLQIQEFSRTRVDRPSCPVDLAAVLAEALEITCSRWKTDAEREGVTIALDRQIEPVPAVLGNGTELREVVTNLILNAVDAMPDGGRLHVGCRQDENRVSAFVEDDGVGMSDSVRRRLFDPFFSTKGVSCSGMGLSVAYGIVRRHGGNIDVTSDPGRGTRFTLEFPVHADEMAEPAEQAEQGEQGETRVSAEPEATPSARILVIDDEPPISELIADTLLIDGHTVDTAPGGEPGVEMAAAREYDLVLTDLGMPDMSGWEVTQAIHLERPGVPVILVTGWGATISQEEVARNGVAAVVHKPFELKPLLEVVSRVLGESRIAAAAIPAAPAQSSRQPL